MLASVFCVITTNKSPVFDSMRLSMAQPLLRGTLCVELTVDDDMCNILFQSFKN